MNKEAPLYDFSLLMHNQPPDRAFIKSMLHLFLENMPVTCENLAKACREQNWEEVHFNAHKLKAGIDTFNIVPLKPVIRRVEKAARNVTPADVPALHTDVQTIAAYLSRCFDGMRQDVARL